MGKLGAAFERTLQGNPVWDEGVQPPPQGEWTEDDYFDLTSCNSFIEYDKGYIEFSPLPTEQHQSVLGKLLIALDDHLQPRGGGVWPPGLSVRTLPGVIRMPDLVAMRDSNDRRVENLAFDGADLLAEVVGDDPTRDYVERRREYEQAGISEYWIVDPETKRVTVLALRDGKFVEHFTGGEGDTATSAMLDGFKVNVTDLFARK